MSSIPNSILNDSKTSMENEMGTSFINHAAEAWAKMRRQWVGDQAEAPRKAPRDPVISWSTTYDDLLSTSERFSQRVPLYEMVDFLVNIWHEEVSGSSGPPRLILQEYADEWHDEVSESS